MLHAVDEVTFTIAKGKTPGIVGESSCGKSTTGRVILRLIEASSGDILFEGKDIRRLNKDQMRQVWEAMQIIFQDLLTSLNPRMTAIEKGPASELFGNPSHPYTRALLSAISSIHLDHTMTREVLQGELTSPVNPAPGCRLAPRCKYATDQCAVRAIELTKISQGHFIACRMIDEQIQ